MARETNVQQARPARRLELPTIIFGPIEVRRLQRELEVLEDFLQQAAIRQPGKQLQLPRTSRILETLAGNNNLNLLIEAERATLKQFLQEVLAAAPVIHLSFASDPSATFTAKVVAWFRTKIHPYALVQLGLQPAIAAGCVMRTSNKVFDFSLRNRFHGKREILLAGLEGPDSGPLPQPTAMPQPAVQAAVPAPAPAGGAGA